MKELEFLIVSVQSSFVGHLEPQLNMGPRTPTSLGTRTSERFQMGIPPKGVQRKGEGVTNADEHRKARNGRGVQECELLLLCACLSQRMFHGNEVTCKAVQWMWLPADAGAATSEMQSG